MNPNLNSQPLDNLMGHAEHFAEFNLRYRGQLPGTLFLFGPEGTAAFVPPTLANENAKDAFAADARLLCVAHGATVAVMAMEAWVTLAEPGVPLDPNQRPSLSPHRREVVVLVGETAGIQPVKFLPILRDAAGNFTGFGETRSLQCDQIQGRYAQLLPPQLPSPDEQARAQAQLRARGILMTERSPAKMKPRTGPRPRFSA